MVPGLEESEPSGNGRTPRARDVPAPETPFPSRQASAERVLWAKDCVALFTCSISHHPMREMSLPPFS